MLLKRFFENSICRQYWSHLLATPKITWINVWEFGSELHHFEKFTEFRATSFPSPSRAPWNSSQFRHFRAPELSDSSSPFPSVLYQTNYDLPHISHRAFTLRFHVHHSRGPYSIIGFHSHPHKPKSAPSVSPYPVRRNEVSTHFPTPQLYQPRTLHIQSRKLYLQVNTVKIFKMSLSIWFMDYWHRTWSPGNWYYPPGSNMTCFTACTGDKVIASSICSWQKTRTISPS